MGMVLEEFQHQLRQQGLIIESKQILWQLVDAGIKKHSWFSTGSIHSGMVQVLASVPFEPNLVDKPVSLFHIGNMYIQHVP
ncbi:conserved hypothetical protein [Ricinus communis]|uniref:Uncharacterized protein n=1 Tax=Ricinus communis TaxID=3988 RepID=B9R6S3_RICCO|nr:conserved hypothetical protein [Ricinus communis]